MNVLIWDDPDPITNQINGNDVALLWQSYQPQEHDNNGVYVSIPKLLEANGEELKAEFLRWHYEFARKGTKKGQLFKRFFLGDIDLWSSSLIAEKCNFLKSPQLNDILKFLAFKKWTEKYTIKKIDFFSSNSDLCEVIKSWAFSEGIIIRINNNKKLDNGYLYRILPRLKAIFYCFRFFFSNIYLGRRDRKIWRHFSSYTFVSYFFALDSNDIENGVFASQYWGSLPHHLRESGIKTNWIHLNIESDICPNTAAARIVLDSFNDNELNNQNHKLLVDFLEFKDFFLVIFLYFKLQIREMKVRLDCGQLLESDLFFPLIRDDWVESFSGSSAMRSLFFWILFDRALSHLSRQSLGIYLLENMDWEPAFIKSWKRSGHGKLVGFPHATVPYWDLRLFFDIRVSEHWSDYAIPDLVAVASKGHELAFSSHSDKKLVPVGIELEALRYCYLLDIANSNMKNEEKVPGRLLVIGDYVAENTQNQLALLNAALEIIDIEIEIVFKPHPGCPVSFSERLPRRVTVSSESLQDLLDKFTMVYASTYTSGAIDAFCWGVPVAVFLDETRLNFSPLRGFGNIDFVNTSNELADWMNSVLGASRSNFQGNEFFVLDNSLPRWLRLFDVS